MYIARLICCRPRVWRWPHRIGAGESGQGDRLPGSHRQLGSSLALVMAGAIAVGLPAFFLAGKRAVTLLGTPMKLPNARQIDRRLVLGSLAFGIGWGLAGFCPGPALVALGAGQVKALVFVAAMLAGMLAFEVAQRARTGD